MKKIVLTAEQISMLLDVQQTIGFNSEKINQFLDESDESAEGELELDDEDYQDMIESLESYINSQGTAKELLEQLKTEFATKVPAEETAATEENPEETSAAEEVPAAENQPEPVAETEETSAAENQPEPIAEKASEQAEEK